MDMARFFRGAVTIFLGIAFSMALFAALPFFGPVGTVTMGGVFIACFLGILFGSLE